MQNSTRDKQFQLGFRLTLLEIAIAFVMTFLWPFAIFFPSHYQILTVALGVAMLTLVAWSALIRDWRGSYRPSPYFLIPFAIVLVGFIRSIGSGTLDWNQIAFMAICITPIILALALTEARVNVKWVALFGILFILVNAVGFHGESIVQSGTSSTTKLNPIPASNLVWMTALALLISDLRKLWKWSGLITVFTLGVPLMLSLREIQPLVAGGIAAFVFFARQREKRASGPGRAFRLAVGSATLLILLSIVKTLLSVDLNSGNGLNGTSVRFLFWKDVFTNGSIWGQGFKPYIFYYAGAYDNERYPHNYIVDCYRISGIVGLLLVALITIQAIRKAVRKGDPNLPLYVGVMVFSFTSFGVFLNAPLWIALCAPFASGAVVAPSSLRGMKCSGVGGRVPTITAR